MKENILTELNKKIEKLIVDKNYSEFKRKESLYQDYFFDAEKYEVERDLYQEQIDEIHFQIENIKNESTRNGSYYKQCSKCKEFIHERKMKFHKCRVSPINKFKNIKYQN